MGFAGMAALTHEMEDVFELLRQRKGGLEREAIDVLLAVPRRARGAVDAIEDDGAEQLDPEPLIARLRDLVRDRTPSRTPTATAPARARDPRERRRRRARRARRRPARRRRADAGRARVHGPHRARRARRVVASAPDAGRLEAFDGREIEVWLATDEPEDRRGRRSPAVPDVAPSTAVDRHAPAAPRDPPPPSRREPPRPRRRPRRPPPAAAQEQGRPTVRVDAERLDQLMHYMGELVVHRTHVEAPRRRRPTCRASRRRCRTSPAPRRRSSRWSCRSG